jgi:hypothetical protein
MPEGVSREGVFGERDEKATGATHLAGVGSIAKYKRADSDRPAAAPPSKGQLPKFSNAPPSMPASETVQVDPRLQPKDQQRQLLLAKMHRSIAAVVERLKNKSAQPSAEEAGFVRNGKAEVQVWLADKSAKTIAQLKRLGFEVVADPKSARMLIGRLSIEKLEALAGLEEVRYVAPMTQ